MTYSIGELSRLTGVKPTTIRWYESEGWLHAAERSEGGHRLYSDAHLGRLTFIRHARELGFESEAIRALLRLAGRPDADCGEAHALASAQVREIDARIERLASLRAELARIAGHCLGGTVGECRIIEALAEPAARLTPMPRGA
ncbi:MerR family transcriptional regulator [Rhodovarius crocodyli]|uniref:MerR family transcriptional regulator n=1 Tax=Rhodovarius crocodyli TaxID=1979269 RepID=A0A437M1R5_9PROT|nr:helix-turn-helix domain-containing protein [Rhodovarius crocodyli]RVT91464.1 MerR family transcriptional regulator [Rhodovarius crocodyli]